MLYAGSAFSYSYGSGQPLHFAEICRNLQTIGEGLSISLQAQETENGDQHRAGNRKIKKDLTQGGAIAILSDRNSKQSIYTPAAHQALRMSAHSCINATAGATLQPVTYHFIGTNEEGQNRGTIPV